jgi:signal transduction histidine kinase
MNFLKEKQIKHKAKNPAPHKFIIVVVCCLCLGLLGSALFTFTTLFRLRKDYLSNRGQVIVTAIESQVRGPGRRNNPAYWQSIFETNYESYSGSVVFLALLDRNGNMLASVGRLPIGSPASAGATKGNVYFFEGTLSLPHNLRSEGGHATAGWRMRAGLNTADADFIQRMAFSQLIVSGLALAAILALSIYLIRMLNRFLELKEREGTEAQLKSLGVMSASLAHEIRNPLGAIKGLTQLAQEELSPDHAAQTQLSTVVNEAERLEKLVTDLLDFARAKEPQLSEFNLAELLSNIKIMLQSRLDEAKAALRLSIDPNPYFLQSDPAGLRQVLLNVMMNAIDATPAHGVVVLTAMRGEDHTFTLIQIDDSGAGLGQKTPEELFQPFVTTKARGTGLGLAISKQIVESLGGSLNLENRPPGGTRCSIMLPMR